jgi:GNAT superfamily N-acetyltransferase
MMKVTLAQEEDDDFDAFLLEQIVRNDMRRQALPQGDFPLTIAISDADGKRCGGLSAETYYEWMRIKLVFVPQQLRGQGYGTRLLAMAEAEARRLHCTGIWLDTFSFQAPDFYAALGYRLFGSIADYPAQARRCFMEKRL